MKRRPWEVSRRTCLRSAGAAIGLPFLEAMVPSMKLARAAGSPAPKYLFISHFAGGTPETLGYNPREGKPGCLMPTSTGSDYQVTPMLEPLAKAGLKEDVLVVSNLHNRIADPSGHSECSLSLLTGTKAPGSGNYPTTPDGPSFDQVAAKALKQFTPVLPSLVLTHPSGVEGDHPPGISWMGPTTAAPVIAQPAAAFNQVFGDGSVDLATVQRRLQRKASVLDYVKGDADRLRGKIGKADQLVLAKYLDSVRSLEERIAATMMPSTNTCKVPGGNLPQYGVNDHGAIPAFMRQMLDLVSLAFECDRTRVAVTTFEVGGWHYKWLGPPYDRYTKWHDDVEHGAGSGQVVDDADLRAETYLKGCTWFVEQFGSFLSGLKEKETASAAGGSLLDATMAVLTSEMAYGNPHSTRFLPVVIGGKGGGIINPGRHIAPSEQPIANLWLTMLNGLGVADTQFGNSTGPLDLR